MPEISIEFGPQDATKLRAKRIDASGLTTAQRALIEARVNDACFFSSKVSDAKLLEKMRDYIAEAAEGKRFRGRADFIATMRALMGASKTKDSGKLTDITSVRRLGLIFDFQQERLSAQLFLAQGEDEDHAWAFPCLELIRVSPRDNPRNWKARWTEAGGKLYDGRMVALRNDPIWRRISRFGSPVPPFDFNSGMGLEEVNRFEAEALGVELPEEGEEVQDPEGVPSDEEVDSAIKKVFQQEKDAIEQNTKQVAEMLGITPGKPMSFKEANELRANPNYETGALEYALNCQSCVVANELRRRGLDVEARPRVRGLDAEQFKIAQDETRAWETVFGGRAKTVSSGPIVGGESSEGALSAITRDTGRYFVTLWWMKGSGCHIFTAERLKGGVLRLYDPQTGSVGSLSGGGNFEGYWNAMDREKGFRVLKVDALKIRNGFNVDRVVQGSRGM